MRIIVDSLDLQRGIFLYSCELHIIFDSTERSQWLNDNHFVMLIISLKLVFKYGDFITC